MRILLALLSSLVGIVLLFGGYRLARIIIPLMGFLAGLSLGGAVIADMSSNPFLGTTLGIVVGLVSGLVLAVLAYLYYYVAVVVFVGSLGYLLGSGFIQLLGFQPGFLSALVGIGLGVVVGIAALMLNLPKYVLIVLTAFAGAVTTIGGVFLLFNKIPMELFSYTAARISISNSFLWTLVALVMAGVGMGVQVVSTRGYELEVWSGMSDEESHSSKPSSTPHEAGA